MQVINLDLFPFIHLFIWSIKKIFLEEISSSHYLKDEFITEFSYFSKSLKKKKKNEIEKLHVPVSLLSCSPNAITGSAEAKKIYAVGANILNKQSIKREIRTCFVFRQETLPIFGKLDLWSSSSGRAQPCADIYVIRSPNE